MSTENGQEKKQNEAVKVTSIARKINFENVKSEEFPPNI